MKLINLTSEKITLVGRNKTVVLPPAEKPASVATTRFLYTTIDLGGVRIPIYEILFKGEIMNLPEVVEKDTRYLVSPDVAMVAMAIQKRYDVFFDDVVTLDECGCNKESSAVGICALANYKLH